MSSCLTSPVRIRACANWRLEHTLLKCSPGLQAASLRGEQDVRMRIVPGACSSVHEDSVDIPDSSEPLKVSSLKARLQKQRSVSTQEDIHGPTCGVDDLAIWRLIYGPGATLSYSSDSDMHQSSPTANFDRLIGNERRSSSVKEQREKRRSQK